MSIMWGNCNREAFNAHACGYDVTVRRAGFGHYDITAYSENAQKLLGKGTFNYEQSEWKKLKRDLKHYGYTIEEVL